MIQKILLKTRMIWMIFIKLLTNSNEKHNGIVTGLFIRGRKLNISFVFIIQSYFAVPKDIKYQKN